MAAAPVFPVVEGRRWPLMFWREVVLLIVVTAFLTAGVKSFVVETFRIPSGSMENTLGVGDRVLVNKFVYRIRGIARGDIVVFSGAGSWGPAAPRRSAFTAAYRDAMQTLGLQENGTDYVKRVIGLPGDHVACCDAQGRITVNGVALHEGSYLYPGAAPSAELFKVTVPAGRLWVMGDNREDSADSRYHGADPGDGTIPESAVIGRVFLVIWPPSQVKSLPIPATFTRHTLAPAAAATIPPGRGAAASAPSAPVLRRVIDRLPAGRR
jgi:signal peptidase I